MATIVSSLGTAATSAGRSRIAKPELKKTWLKIDKVMAAARGLGGKSRRKVRERLAGDARDLGQAVFLQPGDLAGEAVELAVGGEDAQAPVGRKQRQQAQEEAMGVRPEGDAAAIAQTAEAVRCARCAAGRTSPKIFSHLRSASSAASSQQRCCASKVTSGHR